jgi:hypothetical protein
MAIPTYDGKTKQHEQPTLGHQEQGEKAGGGGVKVAGHRVFNQCLSLLGCPAADREASHSFWHFHSIESDFASIFVISNCRFDLEVSGDQPSLFAWRIRDAMMRGVIRIVSEASENVSSSQ